MSRLSSVIQCRRSGETVARPLETKLEKPAMKEVNQAAFLFEEAPDFRVNMCSGFWGGVTPVGLIQANVFQDTIITPASLLVTRVEGGGEQTEFVNPSGIVEDAANFRRRFLMGLLIRPEDAVSMAQWLLNVADQVMMASGVGGEVTLENGQVVQVGIVPVEPEE